MKVAYLILAHKNPEQVRTLVRLLRRSSDGLVVVHVDSRARHFFGPVAGELASLPSTRVVSLLPVQWGHFSIVRAALECMRVALDADPDVQWLRHLSGQDFPIKPVGEFETLLARSGPVSFIEHEPLPSETLVQRGETWGGLERVRRVYVRMGRRPAYLPWIRRAPPPVSLHYGSAFWTLHRSHAAYVLEMEAALSRYFARTLIPDESFFQTALVNSPFADALVGDSQLFARWSAGRESPDVLTDADESVLRGTRHFFARKFDQHFAPDGVELAERLAA